MHLKCPAWISSLSTCQWFKETNRKDIGKWGEAPVASKAAWAEPLGPFPNLDMVGVNPASGPLHRFLFPPTLTWLLLIFFSSNVTLSESYLPLTLSKILFPYLLSWFSVSFQKFEIFIALKTHLKLYFFCLCCPGVGPSMSQAPVGPCWVEKN